MTDLHQDNLLFNKIYIYTSKRNLTVVQRLLNFFFLRFKTFTFMKKHTKRVGTKWKLHLKNHTFMVNWLTCFCRFMKLQAKMLTCATFTFLGTSPLFNLLSLKKKKEISIFSPFFLQLMLFFYLLICFCYCCSYFLSIFPPFISRPNVSTC